MRPEQIRAAIAGGWPVVLPVGVMEYHAEHLPVGVDMLVVSDALALLAVERDIVVLPEFAYAAASHAVAAPEGTGTLHVDATHLVPVATAIFTALLRVGFRNLHVLVHHQTEQFATGMPTDLAFRLAARQAIFTHLERVRGEGWWGRPAAANYYAAAAVGTDPFSWINAHPLLPSGADFPFDHAGIGETSLILAFAPETVASGRVTPDAWYADGAASASPELGRRGVSIILDHLRRILTAGPPAASGE